MGVDKSKRGLTFAHPRISRAEQERLLKQAGAEWINHVGIKPATWEAIPQAIRPGDTVYIYAGPMVPARSKAMKMPLPAQWASFMTEVHARGGTIVEVATGRTTADVKQQRAINAETLKFLRMSGKRLPGAGRKAGRPPRVFTEPEVLKAKEAWFSKDYATNETAERHMPDGFTVTMARRKWGPSGRPWKRKSARRSTRFTTRAD